MAINIEFSPGFCPKLEKFCSIRVRKSHFQLAHLNSYDISISVWISSSLQPFQGALSLFISAQSTTRRELRHTCYYSLHYHFYLVSTVRADIESWNTGMYMLGTRYNGMNASVLYLHVLQYIQCFVYRVY